MTCTEVRSHINALIDGELDSVLTQQIERHLEVCHACSAEVNRLQWLSKTLAEPPMIYTPPPGFEARIRRVVLREAGAGLQRIARPSRVFALACFLLVIVAITWWTTARFYRVAPQELLAQEILQSHVRSLMPGHLIDVASTDQHTVKPWFNGKVDYSPPVPDLSAEGFELVGGRLDYVDERPVAVIVYRKRLHVINLFCWPVANDRDKEFSTEEFQGYHLISWLRESMMYYAVSDVNLTDLEDFLRAYSR